MQIGFLIDGDYLWLGWHSNLFLFVTDDHSSLFVWCGLHWMRLGYTLDVRIQSLVGAFCATHLVWGERHSFWRCKHLAYSLSAWTLAQSSTWKTILRWEFSYGWMWWSFTSQDEVVSGHQVTILLLMDSRIGPLLSVIPFSISCETHSSEACNGFALHCLGC